jgi:hypothetical protein
MFECRAFSELADYKIVRRFHFPMNTRLAPVYPIEEDRQTSAA